MKTYSVFIAVFSLASVSFASMSPINCVQNITPGSGITVTSTNNTSPTVSLSPTTSQAQTFTSSMTVNANMQVGGYIQLLSSTTAGLAQTTPAAVGEMYYCSNCTALRTCVSTGTATGAFASPVAASTACN